MKRELNWPANEGRHELKRSTKYDDLLEKD